MKLQDFLGKDEKWSFDAIAEDADLARQIQILLISLGLLEPPADGKFGPVSVISLKKFQELIRTEENGFLGAVTAKKLIETKIDDLPKPPLKLGNDIASRIVNQHYGFDFPRNDIRLASAGCLVGRTRNGHRNFMAILKQDRHYVANHKYTFYTTVIPSDDLLIGLTQKLLKSLISRTAKTPRAPRIRRVCVSPN
ncbi:peptidoglycan binding domain-containing protein [Nostoc commune NIES-4072]|uniref:Peptidoglycan binding domain-containing protein n=1 Tax=Nostoc commune NIES-4072 TaxID=2005467 RepID=A0A2R5FMK2_NOSCO|nr:peptidoglycan binding domain-containing protein [Nostoc commune HK-02]GBG19249.1 peptidoglycan binding domain-containing protein [Nostoc commune NIES-4072]